MVPHPPAPLLKAEGRKNSEIWFTLSLQAEGIVSEKKELVRGNPLLRRRTLPLSPSDLW